MRERERERKRERSVFLSGYIKLYSLNNNKKYL